MRKINKVAVAGLLALASFESSAFPDRPVTVVVLNAPRGSTDILARDLVGALAKDLGQPVVVENLGGAGGTIPELVKRLNGLGAEVPSQDRRVTQVAESFTSAEISRWAPKLKAAGAKAE